MKGFLIIEEPAGQRLDLALDLLESGESGVSLGHDIMVYRHVGWPEADGKIHFALVTHDRNQSREAAQYQVDRARGVIAQLLSVDQRLADICKAHGVVWEFVADAGMSTTTLATISEDGKVSWPQ